MKQSTAFVEFRFDRVLYQANALNELDLLIDTPLHVEQRAVAPVVHQNDIVEIKLGRLHAVKDRAQGRYIVDGAFVSVCENDFSVELVADEGVVDLSEFRVSFGMTVLGFRNRFRIR